MAVAVFLGTLALLVGGCNQPGQTAAPAVRQPARKHLTLDLGNGVSLELARIPAGTFVMGSPAEEKGRNDDEGPRRKVTISRPFYIGIHEVTQQQYQQLMGRTSGRFKGPKVPVQGVSWHDAAEFCRRLSARTGRSVRLPTETQWEYACRAGATGRFGFGNDDSNLGPWAWFDGSSGAGAHAVGQKKPNAWGLYDMHGNVSEWCRDWYADSYSHSPQAKEGAEATDPAGPASGTARVLRGGCWYDIAWYCRSAARDAHAPDGRTEFVGMYGFRVVAACDEEE